MVFNDLQYSDASKVVMSKHEIDDVDEACAYPAMNRILIKDTLFTPDGNYAINLMTLWHEGYHIVDINSHKTGDKYGIENGKYSRLYGSTFDDFISRVVCGKGLYSGVVSVGEYDDVEDVKSKAGAYAYSKYYLVPAEKKARSYAMQTMQKVLDYADSKKWYNKQAKSNIEAMRKCLAKERDVDKRREEATEKINYIYDSAIKDIMTRATHFLTANDPDGKCILDKVSQMDEAEYVEFANENGNVYEDVASTLILDNNEKVANRLVLAVEDSKNKQWKDADYAIKLTNYIMGWTPSEKQFIRSMEDWKRGIMEQERGC